MPNNPALRRFLLTMLGLYLAWYLLYDLWLLPDGRADQWLSVMTAEVAAVAFRLFGYTAHVQGRLLHLDGQPVVYIDNACNGMVLLAVFAGFMLAFPGPWRKKLFFIPLGLLLVAFLNSLRVVALAVNLLMSRSTFDFNHKYTYLFVVYGCILLLWMHWVKRYSGLAARA